MLHELASLSICRLQFRQGDLNLALMSAYEAMEDAQLLPSPEQWIEAARYAVQCHHELNTLPQSQEILDKVFVFLKHHQQESLQANAESIIGSWLIGHGKIQEAQTYIESAIEKSSLAQEFKVLGRALVLLGFLHSNNSNTYHLALKTFDKLDLILKKQPNEEVLLTSLTLRGFIYTQLMDFKKARSILLEAHEVTRREGFHMMESSILAQLARLYRDQNKTEQYHLYSELALSGVRAERWPRLHKLIAATCTVETSERTSYDFEVNTANRTVHEKSKGLVDFKNQHLIYDMTLLFLKNPGKRYSKENLAQLIWEHKYNPEQHANLIYVTIKRLRSLLEPDFDSPTHILRDRKGYYFNPQSSVQFSEESSNV